MRKNNHPNIVDVISDLQARGFFLDFSLIGDKLLCAQEKCYLDPEEFDVLEMYRFHAHGPTRNETVVYAIESLSQSLKGILLNSGSHLKAAFMPRFR